jgi:hypothetical protein
MIRTANFSDCGKYRYWLFRRWDDRPLAMCIGLNPSTANHETDDKTIELLNNHLPWHNYGGFYMVNLYAFIASKPEILFSAPDPFGENEIIVPNIAARCKDVIFAWGAFKSIEYRANKMKMFYPKALCFGKNKDGSPWHPRALVYKGIQFHESKLSPFKP